MAGLVFTIVGALMIFFWGPPLPDFSDANISLGIDYGPDTKFGDGTTGADRIAAAERRQRLKHRHQVISRIGLGLVILGFVVQFMAAWEAPA
jgi:hypothetical protein